MSMREKLTDKEQDFTIRRLENEGWRWHNNYDPSRPGALEEALSCSLSFTYHPRMAHEMMVVDRAYGLMGQKVPEYHAVYLRSFDTLNPDAPDPENRWVSKKSA